jgi:hypothetical protein
MRAVFGPNGRYCRGFPTDLPVVGPIVFFAYCEVCRGFPTDLPVVGHRLGWTRIRGAVVSLPICPW